MKINLKKSLIAVAVLGFLTLAVILSFNLRGSRAAGNSVSITASDLSAAGFSQVKSMAPTATGRFNGPNLYFSVSDKVSSPSSEAPNIVMISDLSLPYQPSTGALFKYGSDSHDFTVNGGTGKEATMADGRVAINFIKGYNYVVVIGPNQSKIEALATGLAAKIQ